MSIVYYLVNHFVPEIYKRSNKTQPKPKIRLMCIGKKIDRKNLDRQKTFRQKIFGEKHFRQEKFSAKNLAKKRFRQET